MQRSFTKLALSALLLLGLAGTVQAQESNDIIRPITKAGSAAFLFTLGGFGTFNLAGPVVATVSNTPIAGAGMKYFISDDLGLRILLALGTSTKGADSILPAGKTASMNFGLGAALEYHFRPLYSTSPYIGGGVNFGSGTLTTTTKSGGTSTEVKSSGTSIGLGVFAGFDWFFTRGIAIGAEYGLGFTTNSGSTTTTVTPASGSSTSTTSDAPSNSGIALGLNGSASVHAVVYF